MASAELSYFYSANVYACDVFLTLRTAPKWVQEAINAYSLELARTSLPDSD